MATQTKLSNEELSRKIRWEGGILAALDYGIRPAEIADPEIRKLWARLERSYRTIEPLLDEATDRLGVAA
jgi:hypothetical protein